MLKINNLYHRYGKKQVLRDINIEIPTGQIVGLVGPSGCGKSTLLKAILGTDPPSEGTVTADDIPIEYASRNIGMVYQNYFLYEHMTVINNVAWGLKVDQTSLLWPIRKSRIFNCIPYRKLFRKHLDEAAALLSDLGLGGVLNQYPAQLSGGQRQRVAIAQALIMKPKVLLLDEPFGALDEATREDLHEVIFTLAQENIHAKSSNLVPPHTILMVTHELQEAIYVCDRVIGLSQYYVGGHEGATVVYDKSCPDFHSRKAKDLNLIVKQKEHLRGVVFSEELINAKDNVTYWKDSNVSNVS
jgi:NitT/TauT family transport system ATP-binding protein